ncbi:MAG: hypothetical protein JWP44_2241 [Mucilaginibacter sp.]|nr:hypothetical protein [Mucilaginibacter sp.]
MKNIEKPKEGTQKETPKNADKKHGEIKTDSPLSEKDEVKQAEEKMRKTVKKSQ